MISEGEAPEYVAPPTEEETVRLRELQTRHNQAMIAVGLSVPSLFLGYLLPHWAAFVICPVAVVACFTTLYKHSRCRCPRCGGLFNMTNGRGHVWASECAHCGLPLRPRDAG